MILKKMLLALISCGTLITFRIKVSCAPNPEQEFNPDTLAIRGFEIAAPRPGGVDSFVTFIENELIPRKVNTLILRIDYHYQFTSHPELTDSFALSKRQVEKVVRACKPAGIRIIPQINLLGHQSWSTHLGKLLSVYPQFDETPWLPMPAQYVWPNADHFYCKSYCPLAPGLHEVIFDLIDELCKVFDTDAFHAGMDEVFFIGERNCRRCGGRDPAELFAGEVTALRNHLAAENKQLWIWGDRLLDGKTTGLGEWEASKNNTYKAVDRIPKDVIICDWHYERADPTAVYFAMKGFGVISCPFKNSVAGVGQVQNMFRYREQSTPEMKVRFLGMLQTVWSRTDVFLKEFYGQPAGSVSGDEPTASDCFRKVFTAINHHQEIL